MNEFFMTDVVSDDKDGPFLCQGVLCAGEDFDILYTEDHGSINTVLSETGKVISDFQYDPIDACNKGKDTFVVNRRPLCLNRLANEIWNNLKASRKIEILAHENSQFVNQIIELATKENKIRSLKNLKKVAGKKRASRKNKIEAVAWYLRNEESQTQVARLFKVSPSALAVWIKKYGAEAKELNKD